MLYLMMYRQGESEILPGRKLSGRIGGVYVASFDHFVTRAVGSLPLSFEGIDVNFHVAILDAPDGREPWYLYGTEVSNERKLSIVTLDARCRSRAYGVDQGSNLNGLALIFCSTACRFCLRV